ncbi:MAG: pseudaminic acid cytidylyltransferase [Candidatus Zixiibacteriota bacterium]|nr:MAG: pseudaminic acid cytidylyltransferase [candidate division Zixibacteria bacterium]
MRLAIIPARGGSKRIPYKNIRSFRGKPMLAWPIEAARASGLFDHIVVSTDDTRVAEVARNAGAEVPFMRPAELSDDHTGTGAVARHALEWVIDHWERPDNVCLLYATAPFVTPNRLEEGYRRLQDSDAQIVFTATSFPFPIQRAIRLTPEGRAEMFQPEHLMTRSQDLEPAYHDAGQFYWARTEAILDGISAFSHHAIPMILPRHEVQDIDTEEDWRRAELMHAAWTDHGNQVSANRP